MSIEEIRERWESRLDDLSTYPNVTAADIEYLLDRVQELEAEVAELRLENARLGETAVTQAIFELEERLTQAERWMRHLPECPLSQDAVSHPIAKKFFARQEGIVLECSPECGLDEFLGELRQ